MPKLRKFLDLQTTTMASPLVTLITGCSSGIGLATAVKMASDPKKGYIVYATMRNLAKKGELEKAAGSALNATLFVRELDITKEADIVSNVKYIEGKHGRLDVLVNNAAFGYLGPFEKMTLAHMQNMCDTNIVGTFRMTQEVLPVMKKQRSGRILNISSMAGVDGFPFCAVYSATKFAMEGLTEALFPELACFNIKICTICPGPVATNFIDNMDENKGKDVAPSSDKTETEKLCDSYTQEVMKLVNTAQGSDDIADVIIDCAMAADPPVRRGTSDTVNQCIKDRFVDGVGQKAAQNWKGMMAALSKK